MIDFVFHVFHNRYANGKFSLLKIVNYISLFIELAMRCSAHMERACSQIPSFSFGSPPVSSKALPQNYFLTDTTNCLWDTVVLSALCLHKFLLCINVC